MKIFIRRNLILLPILLMILIAFWFNTNSGQTQAIYSLTQDIKKYIEEHDGQFPKSKKDLEEFGVLNAKILNVLKVRYGIEYNNIILKGGSLYDKDGNKVFLIKGDWLYPFTKNAADKCSLELYHLMAKVNDKGTQENH